MLKKISVSAFFFLLFLAVARPAHAQFSQMQGDVKGEDGKPWPNQTVYIDREDIKGHYEVKTDKNGRFFHAGLPLGRYSVSIKLPDGQTFKAASGVQTRLAEPATVPIDLQQVKAQAEAQAAGVKVAPDQGGKMSQEQMEQVAKAAKERDEQIKKRQELVSKFGAAMDAMKAKDYDTAITTFEQAAQVDPTQHVIYAQLGEAYAGKATQVKSSQEKKDWYQKAVDAYKKSIDLKPDDPSYHNNYALALANAGQLDDSQAELVKAAQLDPQNAGQYYFNMGAVLVNTNHMKEAADAFRKATETTPPLPEAYYQLGVTLIGMATVDAKTGAIVPPDGTKEALEKYMQLAPSGPNAGSAKSLLDTISGSVQTQVGSVPSTPTKKK